MKRFVLILTLALWGALPGTAFAQKVTNSSYQTLAYIKSDGTLQDASYRTIGHIKKDGTVQDANYRTIGHADGVPKAWAAWYFFF